MADSHSQPPHQKPCRTCVDFKTWMKEQRQRLSGKSDDSKSAKKPQETQLRHSDENVEKSRHECPLDKDELGRATWSFLHTTAAYLPEEIAQRQKEDLRQFMRIFSDVYPCPPCAEDLRKDIEKNPVRLENRVDFARWLCERHNTVNKKLGKNLFDCSKIDERWRDGWADGSCD